MRDSSSRRSSHVLLAICTWISTTGGMAISAEPIPNPHPPVCPALGARGTAVAADSGIGGNAQARRPFARLLPMADEFVKAGYNVVTLNVLGRWEVVGPSAVCTRPNASKRPSSTSHHVERCHAAGTKAVFYMGRCRFRQATRSLPRPIPIGCADQGPTAKPDPVPNFANIRSGYANWLLKQLEYVTREFHVDGFWFDGYAPVHLHTYDEATKKAFREFSGGKEIPTKFDPGA